MDLMTIIKTRRSIRKFKSVSVPKEYLDSIIEAGIYAASGKNKQSQIVIAVKNADMRKKISEENRIIGTWPKGFDPFYGAPVILIVLASKENNTATYDGSLTLGNMMLRAHELGLGSCWIHRAKQEFEGALGKEILERLNITGDYEGIGHLALGYPEEVPEKIPERRENRTFYLE